MCRIREDDGPFCRESLPYPLMVCGEADAGCLSVKGATLRVSMPYLDPKIYDDGAYEAAKYAERRDDIGRLMLSVIVQARGGIAAGGRRGDDARRGCQNPPATPCQADAGTHKVAP